MKLDIPFVELNKFRASATSAICDAVLDYCTHHGIPVEFYHQITRPVCEFVARSIGVDPDRVEEWVDAGNYPSLHALVNYSPEFRGNGFGDNGFNRDKYINLMIERSEHLIIKTVW